MFTILMLFLSKNNAIKIYLKHTTEFYLPLDVFKYPHMTNKNITFLLQNSLKPLRCFLLRIYAFLFYVLLPIKQSRSPHITPFLRLTHSTTTIE